jgi:hypothetical protein
MASRSDAI